MKIIKRIGPNIDPWGTSVLIGLSEDLALLIVVFWKPKNTPPANVPESQPCLIFCYFC